MAAHGLPYHGWRGLLPLLPLPERYFQCTPCSSLCHCLYSNTPESGGTAACLIFFPLIRYAVHCPDQTDEEYRTEFVLWSLTQSPLIVDTDVRNMTTIMKQALLNEELIAIHQSTVTPPGSLMSTSQDSCDRCHVWGRQLDLNGTDWMIALVNKGRTRLDPKHPTAEYSPLVLACGPGVSIGRAAGNESQTVAVDWALLGWPATAVAAVRDLWAHANLTSNATASFASEVSTHGTAVLRLSLPQV